MISFTLVESFLLPSENKFKIELVFEGDGEVINFRETKGDNGLNILMKFDIVDTTGSVGIRGGEEEEEEEEEDEEEDEEEEEDDEDEEEEGAEAEGFTEGE